MYTHGDGALRNRACTEHMGKNKLRAGGKYQKQDVGQGSTLPGYKRFRKKQTGHRNKLDR